MKQEWIGLQCDGCGEFFGTLQRIRIVEGDTVINYDLCPFCFSKAVSYLRTGTEHLENAYLRVRNKKEE